MQFEVTINANEAENAVRNHLPVQVPSGAVGIAVEWQAPEVRVAFLDGTSRWFHHAYVFVNV